MGALLRPEMLSITDHRALRRPTDILLSRAGSLYRAARFDAARDPASSLLCHALAVRHLHCDESDRAQVRAAFDALPAATAEQELVATFHLCTLALAAGVEAAAVELERAWSRMERYAWQEGRELYGACVDNADACAALLTAFEINGDLRFLRRAETLARTVTARARPATRAHCQWALSLLRLARHPVALAHPGSWMAPHAARLFDAAFPALDNTDFGQLAQALAVAGALAARTGSARQLQRHEQLWALCWRACLDLPEGSPAAAAAVLRAVDLLSSQCLQAEGPRQNARLPAAPARPG